VRRARPSAWSAAIGTLVLAALADARDAPPADAAAGGVVGWVARRVLQRRRDVHRRKIRF